MYVTQRFYLKDGNDEGALDCIVKEWDTVGGALRYLRRYQFGNRYVSCEIQNENGRVVYEDYAGHGETLYDAKGNIVESDDLIDTNPVENGIHDFEMTAKGIEDTEEVLATMADMRELLEYSPIKGAVLRILEKRYRELLRKEVSDNGTPFRVDNELDKVLKEWTDRIKRKEVK